MKRVNAPRWSRTFYLIPVALTLFVAGGCSSEPGNEPTADKTQYQAPKDSMTKTYKSGSQPPAKPAP